MKRERVNFVPQTWRATGCYLKRSSDHVGVNATFVAGANLAY